jgi:predicted acyltransferase
MDPAPRKPLAGGCLLTASILVGFLAGAYVRQPSIGFLAGLGAGLALLGLVWLLDRRK